MPDALPTGGTAPALLSDAALAEIRDRWAKATPGPWRMEPAFDDSGFHDIYGARSGLVQVAQMSLDGGDAEFIAGSWADVAALLADNARLRAIVTAICGDLEQAARVADQMKGCEHRWRPGALGLGCQYCGEPLPVGDAMKGETK